MTPVLTSPPSFYTIGFARGRPFASGNLGIAWIVTAAFVGSNGFGFTGNELPLVGTVLELAQNEQSIADFAHYLRCNCDPLNAA